MPFLCTLQASDAHDFYGAMPALHAAKTAMQTSLTAAQHSNGADEDGHSADRIAAISPTQPSRHAGVSSSQPLAEAPAGIVSSPSAGDLQRQEQWQSGDEAGFSPVDAVVQQQCLRQSSAPVAVLTMPLPMSASPAGEAAPTGYSTCSCREDGLLVLGRASLARTRSSRYDLHTRLQAAR